MACAGHGRGARLRSAPPSAQRARSASGRWVPSPDVLRLADRHRVPYTGAPRVGDGGRCASRDPFVCSCTHPACSRGLPGTLELAADLRRRFPQLRSAGGFDCCRQNTADPGELSVHSIGRALDLGLPRVAGEADRVHGDPIAAWLLVHAEEVGVQLVIWDRSVWQASRRPGERLRAYTGPVPHTDHLHVELSLDGARRRTRYFAGAPAWNAKGPESSAPDAHRSVCEAPAE